MSYNLYSERTCNVQDTVFNRFTKTFFPLGAYLSFLDPKNVAFKNFWIGTCVFKMVWLWKGTTTILPTAISTDFIVSQYHHEEHCGWTMSLSILWLVSYWLIDWTKISSTFNQRADRHCLVTAGARWRSDAN